MLAEDRVRLQHMIDAGQSVATFIKERERRDLDHDQMLLFAVVPAIEIVGAAAARLTDAAQAELPQIPWPAIVSMRNRLVHGYFEVDPDIVWATATEEMPTLVAALLQATASS